MQAPCCYCCCCCCCYCCYCYCCYCYCYCPQLKLLQRLRFLLGVRGCYSEAVLTPLPHRWPTVVSIDPRVEVVVSPPPAVRATISRPSLLPRPGGPRLVTLRHLLPAAPRFLLSVVAGRRRPGRRPGLRRLHLRPNARLQLPSSAGSSLSKPWPPVAVTCGQSTRRFLRASRKQN